MNEPPCVVVYLKTAADRHGHKIDIYSIDGEWVRFWRDVGFIGGGHENVDKYLRAIIVRYAARQPGEDAKVVAIEDVFVQYKPRSADGFERHETNELEDMDEGMKYPPAHDDSENEEAKYYRGRFGVPAPYVSQGNF